MENQYELAKQFGDLTLHELILRNAIAQGKYIPQKVLRDYPHLLDEYTETVGKVRTENDIAKRKEIHERKKEDKLAQEQYEKSILEHNQKLQLEKEQRRQKRLETEEKLHPGRNEQREKELNAKREQKQKELQEKSDLKKKVQLQQKISKAEQRQKDLKEASEKEKAEDAIREKERKEKIKNSNSLVKNILKNSKISKPKESPDLKSKEELLPEIERLQKEIQAKIQKKQKKLQVEIEQRRIQQKEKLLIDEQQKINIQEALRQKKIDEEMRKNEAIEKTKNSKSLVSEILKNSRLGLAKPK